MNKLDNLVWSLCRDVHENWVRVKHSQGYSYGPVTDKIAKTHRDIKPYEELTKENIAVEVSAVWSLIITMNRCGYQVLSAEEAQEHMKLGNGEARQQLIEVLCREAHESWVRLKAEQGYVYGQVTDDVAKTNSDLRPYEEISDEKRQLDRSVVETVIEGIHRRAYYIVRRENI
jgi:hypothetical protein